MDDVVDPPLLPPNSQLESLGVTDDDVMEYPTLVVYDDKLFCAMVDCCRKHFVGVDGTNLQMIDTIGENEGTYMCQVSMFLVKNRIKPLASDVMLLAPGVQETAKRLGHGDIHAVNRRHQLTGEGVLKPAGDDIVPDAVRVVWIGE
jgi:hypothetical protein